MRQPPEVQSRARRPGRGLCGPGVAALTLSVLSCGGGHPDGTPRASTQGSRPAPATIRDEEPAPAPARCTPVRIQNGSPPRWAQQDQVPKPAPPFVVAYEGWAAGFLFVNPMRVHLPSGGANKILWAMDPGAGRDGTLEISARDRGRSRAERFTADTADSDGRIYRTRLQFPRAGCWRLSLTWGAHHAVLDVDVRP